MFCLFAKNYKRTFVIMKKRRLVIIFSTFCVIVFLSIFASQVFKLKVVEVVFFDEEETKIVKLENNAVFNTKDKVNSIVSSVNFDYGDLVFLINKSCYEQDIERKNPYLKLKNIEVKFPNKLIVNATERKPLFYISTSNKAYLLDNEFKLLDIITQNESVLKNLTEIIVQSPQNENRDFFNFFNILPSVYEAGQNLKENNLVISNISNMPNILQNYITPNNKLSNFTKQIILQEKTVGTINLKICTNISSYGITLTVENVFSNFDIKINKLINAFNTLKKAEPIKTSYGELKIDQNLNCFWNNL